MTAEDLKKAAAEIFAEKGYEAATLSDIAAAVGIKKPSIYAHYSSKEALFLEVWKDLVADYRLFVERGLKDTEGEAPETRLFHIFTQYGTHFSRNPELMKLWTRFLMYPPENMRERIETEMFAVEIFLMQHVAQIFADGIARGEVREAKVEDLVAAFSCLREGYLMWLKFFKIPDAESKARVMWEFFWNGIGTSEKR